VSRLSADVNVPGERFDSSSDICTAHVKYEKGERAFLHFARYISETRPFKILSSQIPCLLSPLDPDENLPNFLAL